MNARPCIVCGGTASFLLDGIDLRFYVYPIEPLCFSCLSWAHQYGIDPTFRVSRGGYAFTWRFHT